MSIKEKDTMNLNEKAKWGYIVKERKEKAENNIIIISKKIKNHIKQ